MVTLFITSISKGAGKTAICAGLGSHLKNSGKKIGYFAPSGETSGTDAAFIHEVLSLAEARETTFENVARGKDIMLVEGMESSVVDKLNAPTILIARYDEIDSLTGLVKKYKHLAGIIINKVPVSQLKKVRTETVAILKNAGVKVFGVLPEDKSLMTITISELARLVDGKILNNPEKGEDLVENFMLGAMTFDSGLSYFGRKANKAAIVNSERPDIQMAALATQTRVLVLYGNSNPQIAAPVEIHAAQKKIPILTTGLEAEAITNRIEKMLSEEKFDEKTKVPRIVAMMSQSIDYAELYKTAGI